MARAQNYQYPPDDRDPTEYNDEDSQPLKIASYAIAPIGFLLEWTIARPLHYLSTQTPLAPVLGGDRGEDGYPPLPIAELPPDNIPNGSETAPYAVVPSSPVVVAPVTAAPQSAVPIAPAPSTSQPVLH
jgi:hypothetical protein